MEIVVFFILFCWAISVFLHIKFQNFDTLNVARIFKYKCEVVGEGGTTEII